MGGGGSVFVFALVCIALCPFQFCNHLEVIKRACCFVFIVLRMSCYCKCSVMALPQGAVGCLQCVMMVFPDHTHLLFIQIYFIRMRRLNTL